MITMLCSSYRGRRNKFNFTAPTGGVNFPQTWSVPFFQSVVLTALPFTLSFTSLFHQTTTSPKSSYSAVRG